MAKKHASTFKRADFIAWDGEGINYGEKVNGLQKQAYVLLANSDGEEIFNPKGLSTIECLRFLTDNAKKHERCHNHGIHVVFGASYDFNMILRDLSREEWERINTYEGNPARGVWYHGYVINLVNRKYLTIRKLANPERPYKIGKNGKPKLDVEISMTLWDVISFFQSSFLDALNNWIPQSSEVMELLAKGKSLRNEFSIDNFEFVREYNRMELQCLVKLMQALQKQLRQPEIDLTLTRWDGAGAIATALLKKHKAKEYIAPLPPEIEQAARTAYFGGRFESIKFGTHCGKVFDYDICSAYPFAMMHLPDLQSGMWRHIAKVQDVDDLQDFSLLRITWDYRNSPLKDSPFFPFPYRSAYENRILFPRVGHGWLWLPEVKAAIRNGFDVNIKECFSFYGSKDIPFAWVKKYYDLRRQWIRDAREKGTQSGEKVIKLGLNSLYGKLAQHIGYDAELQKIPPFHSLAFAGFITSMTRAALFNYAMDEPDAVIFFATDGIFTTTRLDDSLLTKDKELGKWEETVCDELINVQSGVYFYRHGEQWAARLRGFDKPRSQEKIIEYIDKIKTGWKNKREYIYLPCTRFIGYKTALISEEWYGRHCGWYTVQEEGQEGRKLSIIPDGGKRILARPNQYPKNLDKHLMSSIPEYASQLEFLPEKDFPLSEAYEVGWGCDIAWNSLENAINLSDNPYAEDEE